MESPRIVTALCETRRSATRLSSHTRREEHGHVLLPPAGGFLSYTMSPIALEGRHTLDKEELTVTETGQEPAIDTKKAKVFASSPTIKVPLPLGLENHPITADTSFDTLSILVYEECERLRAQGVLNEPPSKGRSIGKPYRLIVEKIIHFGELLRKKLCVATQAELEHYKGKFAQAIFMLMCYHASKIIDDPGHVQRYETLKKLKACMRRHQRRKQRVNIK